MRVVLSYKNKNKGNVIDNSLLSKRFYMFNSCIRFSPPKVDKSNVSKIQHISNNKIAKKFKDGCDEKHISYNQDSVNKTHYVENISMVWVKSTIIDYKIKFLNFKKSIFEGITYKSKIDSNKVIIKNINENESEVVLYNDVVFIPASDKIKILKNLNEKREIFESLIQELYPYLTDLNMKFLVNEIINRYNHGSILLFSNSEKVGFEILSTTLNLDKMIQLHENEDVVEIVQNVFFDESTNAIGVSYTQKLTYLKSDGNLGAYTISKINNPTFERVIIEHLRDSSRCLDPYLLTADELLNLDFNIVKLKKNIKLRAEETLRININEETDILSNDNINEDELIAYVREKFKTEDLINTINYSSRGVYNSQDFKNICTSIINDEAQILWHIAYYINLSYTKPEKIDEIFSKYSKLDDSFLYNDNRMALFDDLHINEALYFIIKEHGINNLKGYLTVDQIYDLVKEKIKEIESSEI